ncbi:hypothetical protein [Dokdonia sp.]|uniref:hypothetical protein n=1 Tax=Dokdonia sp. TaxID=2024995 RepID=UPI003267A589
MKNRIEYLFIGCLLVFILLHEQYQPKEVYKENTQEKGDMERLHKLDSLQMLLETCQSKNLNNIQEK